MRTLVALACFWLVILGSCQITKEEDWKFFLGLGLAFTGIVIIPIVFHVLNGGPT